MASTYEPIATTTLGSATATITFSSISSAYTDLRIVMVCTSASNTQDVYLRFNSDTGTNYSQTALSGDGTTASSSNYTNGSRIIVNKLAYTSSTYPHLYTMDIFSYAGSTYKTVLTTALGDNNGGANAGTDATVCLWRSTSAINSVEFKLSAGNYNTGTTVTLWGIKAA